MTSRPTDEARLWALLAHAEPPELPERLSAGRLFDEAAARREPAVASVHSYWRTEAGAPVDFGSIIQAAG
jgi:hypothetical protein